MHALAPLALATLPLLSCASPAPADGTPGAGDGGTPSTDSGAPDAGAPVFQFSYALIADPHVTSEGEHQERLQQAVAWVAEQADDRDIELVFVLGDIAWNEGFAPAVAALDALPVPWLPVLGDNPIQSGDEEAWHDAFDPVLQARAAALPGWSRAPTPVDNPVQGGQSHLQSYAFDHRGLRFVALDWNSREVGTLWGETPDLHDFSGGTLPFLQAELDAASAGEGLAERVVLLSHMPMIVGPGSFDLDEGATLEALLGPAGDLVAGNHAGHLHGNGEDEWAACGMTVDTTDATWDDVVSLRVVQVWTDAAQVHSSDEVVELE